MNDENESLITTKDKNQVEDDVLLISLRETSRITGLGRSTLLKLVKLKGFPALVFPGKILVDKNAILPWIRKNYGKFEN